MYPSVSAVAKGVSTSSPTAAGLRPDRDDGHVQLRDVLRCAFELCHDILWRLAISMLVAFFLKHACAAIAFVDQAIKDGGGPW